MVSPESQVEAEAAQAQAASATGEAGQTQAGAGTDERDAKIAELEAKNADWEHRYKSLQGVQSVRLSGPDVMAKIEALETQIATDRWERQRQRWETDPNLSDAERREKVQAIDQQEHQAQVTSAVRATSTRMAEELSSAIRDAEIAEDHPTVKEAIEKWRNARSIEDYVAITVEMNKFIVSEERRKKRELEAALKKENEAIKKQYNVENNSLATGSTTGTPTAGSLSDEKYNQLLKSGAPLPSATEIDRLTAKYASGR